MTNRDELKAKAIAIIRQRPGIDEDRLALAIGLPARTRRADGRSQRNKTVRKILAELEAEEEICAERPQFATAYEPRKLYAADYVRPPKKPLFQPAKKRNDTLKTWIDPSLIGSYEPENQPQRSPLEKLATQQPKQTWRKPIMPDRSSGEIRAAVSEQIRLMVESAEVVTRNKICTNLGISSNYFCNNTDAQEEYDRAIRAIVIKQKIAAAEAKKTVEGNDDGEGNDDRQTLSPDNLALQQELEQLRQAKQELEERNRELRQQLAEAQQVQPKAAPLDPAQFARQELERWKVEAERLRDALTKAETSIAAYEQILSLHSNAVPVELNGKH